MDKRLEQIRMNALTAKFLHRTKIAIYGSISKITAIITIIVPILFLFALYAAKETPAENVINFLSTIFGVALLITGIIYIVFEVDKQLVSHKMGLRKNTYVASETQFLLSHSVKGIIRLEWFYRYISEMDTIDTDVFARLSERRRQKAYREALKEFEPGNDKITCPTCESSPWRFHRGECQLCGGSYKTDAEAKEPEINDEIRK